MTPGSLRRVAVTGIGAVSAWGWGVEALWSGVCSGRTAIGNFDRFPHEDYRTHLAAQVPEPLDGAEPQRFKRLSLAERFALFSAAEALKQAGLPDDLSSVDAGVFSSSSTGGMLESEDSYIRLRAEPGTIVDLREFAAQTVNGPGDAVARVFRVNGPVQAVSSACASGTMAVGMAVDAIREGQVRIALTGGADCLCRTTFGGFNSLRSIDEKPALPFRQGREGLSLGEGGAFLVLEVLDDARARGTTILAEVRAVGSSSDAHHMTAPEPQGAGAVVALRRALDEAGRDPDTIGFVNAHGTGTPLNDAAEWNALREVFGERAGRIPITSTKGSIGHLLGTAGLIEAVVTVLCLQNGQIHPTPGGGRIDSELPLNLVLDGPVAVSESMDAVSLNLGFGGGNSAVILSGWRESE